MTSSTTCGSKLLTTWKIGLSMLAVFLLVIGCQKPKQESKPPYPYPHTKGEWPSNTPPDIEVGWCLDPPHELEELAEHHKFGKHKVLSLPRQIPCPGKFRIHGFHVVVTSDCTGLGGPTDSKNSVCETAAKAASEAALKVSCANECSKATNEVFRGWACPTPWAGATTISVATASVVLEVECVPRASTGP